MKNASIFIAKDLINSGSYKDKLILKNNFFTGMSILVGLFYAESFFKAKK